MHNNTIITIGREFGSGGREIGKLLAEKLDVPFYDRDLITLAAEKSGFSKDYLEHADEKPGNMLLQSFAVSSIASAHLSLPTELSINDRLFFAQSEVIRRLADKGSCVIVGRCADYVLRDRCECVNVFIYADIRDRTDRVARLYSISVGEARTIIQKTDKKRASYYNYYSGKEWHNLASYDISINSSTLGIENTASVLHAFAETKDREVCPGL